MNSQDANKLTALVQSAQQGGDQDQGEDGLADAQALGAPDAATYEGHSGGIVEVLEGLLDKAQAQLAAAQKKETAALHNFGMLKQSLTDEIKYANKQMTDA